MMVLKLVMLLVYVLVLNWGFRLEVLLVVWLDLLLDMGLVMMLVHLLVVWLDLLLVEWFS